MTKVYALELRAELKSPTPSKKLKMQHPQSNVDQ